MVVGSTADRPGQPSMMHFLKTFYSYLLILRLSNGSLGIVRAKVPKISLFLSGPLSWKPLQPATPTLHDDCNGLGTQC